MPDPKNRNRFTSATRFTPWDGAAFFPSAFEISNLQFEICNSPGPVPSSRPRFPNPNGIQSFSEGLGRPRPYPGCSASPNIIFQH